MKRNFILSFILLSVFQLGFSQNVVTVTDADLTGSTTWYSDTVYMLDGFVFLEEGTLTIEAGTVVKGKEIPTTGDNASALIITRGAMINAVGNPRKPIIFTAEIDDVSDPADLLTSDRGLWGGVILLGSGILGTDTETKAIEGIPEGETRAEFGGNDNTESSGTMKYVSIRHGGAELGPGNEINGLTFGGVGSGTVIENVEVIANDDDGFEWFGGAASAKFLVSAFNKDDAFDYDFGWQGKGQFWFVVQGTDEADNAGEHDGSKPDDAAPFSSPTIYNVTYLGSGVDATTKNSTALHFRDNAGGMYANSVFTDFAKHAIEVEDLPAASGTDSRQRMEAGDLVVKNNVWYAFGSGDQLNATANGIIRPTENAEDPDAQFLIDHLSNNNNSIEDPMLRGISRITDEGLDPRPMAGSPLFGELAAVPADDDFFTDVDFRGAFGYSNWATQWTAIDAYGYFGDLDGGFGATTVYVSDDDLDGSTTWTNDKTYILDGFVFLEQGTLSIEPGTVIKGKEVPSTGDNASALIITPDAKINAVGSPELPIIFTSEIDDVSDNADLLYSDRGLWGGVILLGNGILGTDTETKSIEGIPEGEDRAIFGGNDNEHNSGTMKYVSIRHGGAELGPGNEINGLTFGGVGSQTVIEHVEVIANDDDGFEWFGGAVGAKWLVSAFNKDDAFDYDFGWEGKGQFWFVIQGTDEADNAGEHDGSKPDDASPFSNPTIFNVTYIGSGVDAATKNSTALHFRDNTGGTYANSIFTDFAKHAIEVEDLPAASGTDSRQRMEAGDLKLMNNIWFGFGSGDQLSAGANGIIRATEDAEDPDAQFLVDHLSANNNSIEDPMLRGISRMTDQGLDPRPKAGSPALSGASALPADDDFFTPADFRGAFGFANWAAQWTAVDAYGIFGNLEGGFGTEEVIVTDADLTGDAEWTNDKTYILDGFVFLEQGTLNIQPGTVVKGKEVPTSGDNASALIITRGAQIDAEGSAEFPIIFTAEIDDVSDPDDLSSSDRGLWGGVILLGNGILGTDTETKSIEGIPEGEARAEFGGNDNSESSGIMKYVSIRHGGAELGPGNEINGLTFGGVGSGTVIENVEVIANDDDGFEWFGGAANAKWLVSAFNKDDAFDYDFGWQGMGQFWFAIQGTDEADNAGEHDGAKPDDATPFSNPTIFNATYIGSGVNAATKNSTAIHFRDNTGGMYANSIFTDFAKHAIEVEDLPAASGADSRERMENGDLVVKNNIWYGFGSGDQLDASDNGIIRATEDAEDPDAQFLIDHLSNNNNSIEDPKLAGISRAADEGLDPRPNSESPAWENLAGLPGDDFFLDANYKGAFGETNWAAGWTAVDFYGYFGDILSGVEVYESESGLKLSQNYPNPFNYSTMVSYTLPEAMEVELVVFDITGKVVQMVVNREYQFEGEHVVTISGLNEGMYFYRLSAGDDQVTRKMIVTR